MIRLSVISLAGVVAFSSAQPEAAVSTEPVPLTVGGGLLGKKGGPAEDLSGMVCRPPETADERLCVLIDDETSAAQWVTLRRDAIEPGGTVSLDRVAEVVGPSAAPTACPGGTAKAGKQDVDGEAVAYAAPYWYVIGSHGCSRKRGLYSPPAFRLYRFQAGAAVAQSASTRFREQLKVADGPARFAEKALDANGVTVEGFAVVGRRAYAGLRALVEGARAYLLEMDLAALFASGTGAAALPGRPVPIALGKDMGVRDLAALPDGRLLVLAGPAQDQAGSFSIAVVDPASGAVAPVPGWTSPARKDLPKAESLTVLSFEAGVATVIMMFDGVAGGAPLRVAVAVPPSAAALVR